MGSALLTLSFSLMIRSKDLQTVLFKFLMKSSRLSSYGTSEPSWSLDGPTSKPTIKDG